MPVTPVDILTLARAVDREGSPAAGVAWTLIQRAAWLVTHGVNVKLGRLVEQYAQPINPEWFPNGEKHVAEVARLHRLGKHDAAMDEEARAVARVKYAQKPWSALKQETRDLILQIFAGQVPSPVQGAVHYWESRAPDFAGNQAVKPGLVLLDRGFGFDNVNVFFAEKGSEGFGGIKVLGALTSTGGAVLGLLVAVGSGLLAWKWLRA